MSTLHTISGSGHAAAEGLATRHAHHPVAAAEHATSDAAAPDAAAPDATADAGVQVSFSPQSLKVLEDTALHAASTARGLVRDIGDAGAELVTATAEAIDHVGAGAAHVITAGADALVKGVTAVRSGVSAAATAASDAVSEATERVGSTVESTVGYATLAALAVDGLLNELA